MIMHPENVVIDNILISKQKGNNCNILYKTEEELVRFKIQTGKMRVPWDPKERKNQNGKVISTNVCASTFGILDTSNKKRIETFKTKVECIEKLLPIDEGASLNSVLYGTNPNYSPVINLSIPYSDGKPEVIVFDSDGNILPFTALKKGCICTFIVRVSHFWMFKNKRGLQLVIEQVKMHKSSPQPVSFLQDDSDSD
jgi:hypothetical protein